LNRLESMTRLLALALAATLLAGCSAYQAKNEQLQLERLVRDYTKAVRWNDFEGAAIFLRDRDGSLPAVDFERLKGIRVTNYEYTVTAPTPGSQEARMTAVFDYQMPATMTVRTVTQSAIWWFDPAARAWFLEGGLPAF